MWYDGEMDTQDGLLIVSLATTMPGAQLLLEAARSQSVAVKVMSVEDEAIVSEVEAAREVVYRIGPKSVARYERLVAKLSSAKARQLQAILVAFDKIASWRALHDAGVPMPKSWVIDADATWETFPIVVKVPQGNRGDGVELVRSADEFKAVTAQFFANNTQLLCQEYIAESRGADKRLIMTPRGLVAAMRRKSAGDDFRANLHQGATAESFTPTSEEQQIAAEALRVLGLSFGGVDLIDSNRGPLVLEVNPSPGFGISSITGVDVPGRIVREIMESSKS